MNSHIKRKYRKVRQEFKRDLFEKVKDNRAFAMLIIETYAASRHREHITEIWELLGFHYREAYTEYCNKLAGKALTAGMKSCVRYTLLIKNCTINTFDEFQKHLQWVKLWVLHIGY